MVSRILVNEVIYLTSVAGLGHALTRALSFQPETNIIATVRSTESLPALEALPIHQTSKIIPFLITFGAETEDLIQSAISSLRETHPWLTQIDTVIASAAISKSPGRVIETLSSDLREHLAVNAVAVAALFQATWPLLKLAPIPRFVVISSIGGSIKEVPQTSAFASVAYGMSKAALNYLIRKIGVENEDLAIMAIHPGSV